MAPTVEQLGPNDREALRAFLAKDPVQNLYMLGLLEEFGVAPRASGAPFAFFGQFLRRELTASLFVGSDGGLLLPSANSAGSVAEIASSLSGKVRLRSCIGEKPAVDLLVRHLGNGKVRHSRLQRLFSVSADDLGPFTNPTLRQATLAELPDVVKLAASATKEALGRNPLEEDPQGFQERVARRVKCGRTYVLEVNGRLVFKLDVGSRSPHGAELEGLYTVPEERRQGHATLSLGQISRHLLSSLPRLTLRVDERDPSLAGVARKVGYVAGKEQRLVLAE